jgi:hypothetical protein
MFMIQWIPMLISQGARLVKVTLFHKLKKIFIIFIFYLTLFHF